MGETLQRRIAERSAKLREVGAHLKAELFGIDDIIDRALDAVRAWYVLPELVQRPVIVCLWGLTGTGKTQLVRRLAQLLGCYDRFVEVQMDGFSHGSGYYESSISGLLAESGIGEGEPGILLLDEFQRFRTVDDRSRDIKVERYQDVWALLSDGRLPPSLSFMADLEMSVASARYSQAEEEEGEERDEAATAPPARPRKRRFQLSPWQARELQRSLKLAEPLQDIMGWSPAQLEDRLASFRRDPGRWGTDYSRLLVFVTGNLDEMYEHVARRVEDCDTDADIFHRYTRRLSVIDAKKALAKRFRPEQVARLGNVHLVYPSLDRAAYERLVDDTCGRLAAEAARSSGLAIEVGADVRAEIYANGVFPAQGTRPLFSTAQGLLGTALVNATLWALEQGAEPGDALHIGLAADRRHLTVRCNGASLALPAAFDLNRLKQRAQADFRALLAVHEAGHALLYALLLRQLPLEVKINVASFDGGYNSFQPLRAKSRRDVLDLVCVTLGGRAAEQLVFGADACTTGAEQDLLQATRDASNFVRNHGFAGRLARTDNGCDTGCETSTAMADTDAAIEHLLGAQFERAQRLLREHAPQLAAISQQLALRGEVSQAWLGALLGVAAVSEPAVLQPYAQRLAAFTAAQGAVVVDAEEVHVLA